MTLRGTISSGTIVLDQPASLPEGTRVEVLVTPVEASPEGAPRQTLSQRLLKHAGSVTGLPADMAAQHDHYIHGAPKR